MTDRRPLIAVITNLDYDGQYLFPGYPRITINEDYPRSIAAAGGVPVLLPPHDDLTLLGRQLEGVDGLVLAGGADVDPLLYGQDPAVQTGAASPVRDAYEFEALRLAFEADLPVLAICRGLQVLNVWLGGTLHQDNALTGTTVKHWGAGEPSRGLHRIAIERGSFLAEAWGVDASTVNSFHHQCLDRVADGLRVVARASDGIIEAAELTGDPSGRPRPAAPVVGVQWHPEMMSRENAQAQALFRWFVERCRD